ncbi:Uncharacterized protein APZ42_033817 [Daphnia magna]|uniref:MULE transposase domain-containing protein n=1 Tax=Daphnia magna TaxID=35525 RepID=A0A164KQ14_9CRUS|nr:Uncharacterized protein APZ42_033817 [Daphnia magna]
MSEISDGPSEAVFKIYPAASVKGKDLLLDGIGHKYGVKAKYPNSVTWICTARRGKTSASDTKTSKNPSYKPKAKRSAIQPAALLGPSQNATRFFCKEVFVGDGTKRRRHLIFATENKKKISESSYTMLFSIHGFINKNSELKQIPLVFVFMTTRRSVDYSAILEEISSWLESPYSVQEIVSDYERAMWAGIKKWKTELKRKNPELNIKHSGCAFHLNQAFHRGFKELKLPKNERENRTVRKWVRRLQCLHLLPGDFITPVFELIQKKVLSSLNPFLDYIEKVWIRSKILKPEFWTSFRKAIRTNNDAEGWHLRINRRGRCFKLGFMELTILLHKEATFIPIQASLLSQGMLKRTQKKITKLRQNKIFKEWAAFEKSDKTTDDAHQLLIKTADIYIRKEKS